MAAMVRQAPNDRAAARSIIAARPDPPPGMVTHRAAIVLWPHIQIWAKFQSLAFVETCRK